MNVGDAARKGNRRQSDDRDVHPDDIDLSMDDSPEGDNQDDQDINPDDIDLSMDDSPDGDLGQEGSGDENSDELDSVASAASEDPNSQGLDRSVDGAHLVAKRRADDDTYTELWMFKTADLKADMKLRRDILADTDIPVGRTQSPDGSQRYTTWACGNVEFVEIVGLPN